MKTKVIISGVFIFLMFAGHNLTFAERNIDEGSPFIKVGNKLCPVSGKKVGDMGSAVEFEYNGEIYSFCCAGCIDTFESDPEKYARLVKGGMREPRSGESKGQTGLSHGHNEATYGKGEQHAVNASSRENPLVCEYEVFGMDCPGCHQGLEKLVKKIPSVEEAEANWKKKRMTVTIRPGEECNDEDIYDAVKRANFTVGKRIK